MRCPNRHIGHPGRLLSRTVTTEENGIVGLQDGSKDGSEPRSSSRSFWRDSAISESACVLRGNPGQLGDHSSTYLADKWLWDRDGAPERLSISQSRAGYRPSPTASSRSSCWRPYSIASSLTAPRSVGVKGRPFVRSASAGSRPRESPLLSPSGLARYPFELPSI